MTEIHFTTRTNTMPTPTKPDNALRLSLRASVRTATNLSRFSAGGGAEGAALTDVLLMQTDREASGHGVWLDAKTAETALAVNAGARLHAFLTHDDFAWVDDLSRSVGYFEGLYLDDAGALRAKTFRFFDSFAASNAEAVERIMEMAKTTPDLICISIEFWGYAVQVAKDGTEYTPNEVPEGVELANSGMPVVRVTDLTGAAFVGHGAATDGLFSRFARFFGFGGRRVDAGADGMKPATIQDITAAFGETNELLSRATKLFAAAGGTVESIRAAMAAEDHSAEVLRLRADNERLTAQVTALTGERDVALQERDAARTQFAEIKDSGHASTLRVGPPTSTPKSPAEAMEIFSSITDPTRRAEFYAANKKLLR